MVITTTPLKKRFGRLVVIEQNLNTIYKDGIKRPSVICKCDCGTIRQFITSNLLSGNCNSCGCLHKELLARRSTTHGLRKSKEYNSWSNMKRRCYDNQHKKYPRYGGRGITVCTRWIDSFSNFFKDMGAKPANTSIDRIDNDGIYEPDNCQWATSIAQSRNRSTCKYTTHDDVTLTHTEWSLQLGGSTSLVRQRLKAGWSEIKSITTPPQTAKL